MANRLKITRLVPDGYGGKREGSFAGKTPAPLTGDICYLPTLSLMRNTAVPTTGTMANTTVPTAGTMTNSLPVMAEMRSTVVASQGAMSNSPGASEADLC